MNKKIAAIIVLMIVLSSVASASAAVTVGVKKGDWIEYAVTYAGTPPEQHAIIKARLEISAVNGAEIIVTITTTDSNGTSSLEMPTLNIENGILGDDFIIPANLKTGDTFYDKSSGNTVIDREETRTYVGSSRVVVIGSKQNTTDCWDQATGVLLEGISAFADYNITAKVDAMSLSQSGSSQQAGADQTIFIVVAIAVVTVIIVATAVILVARHRKKRAQDR